MKSESTLNKVLSFHRIEQLKDLELANGISDPALNIVVVVVTSLEN